MNSILWAGFLLFAGWVLLILLRELFNELSK